MRRSEPTGPVGVRGLEHSVVELPWGVLRGALGASDGTAGAKSNVPSALAVLRHATLYKAFPEEIEEAFEVLERHAMRAGQLYPVAVTVVPFLFDMLRRESKIEQRIADLIASYAALAVTLEPELRGQLRRTISDHAVLVAGWLGCCDRAAGALAIHVPALRNDLFEAITKADELGPEIMLALVELGAAPGRSRTLALARLLDEATPAVARMCAAAFLSRHGDLTPDLRTRIDAALPPDAASVLCEYVHQLWKPTVERPVVAPKLYDAEVVFADDNVLMVNIGDRSVVLPWNGAMLERGARLKVGVTAHGQARLAVITDRNGGVRVVDF